MTETQRDVVELLSADHREFDRIFTELEGLMGRSGEDVLARKRALVDEVSIGLVKHSVAEETMKRLERLDPSDEQYDVEIRTLIHEIRTHVEHEEGRMFTELKASFTHDQLVEMAQQVERIKAIAPTRPHPLVPNEGGIRTALGPVAALVDHLRDAVSGRGKQDT